jgi:antirestriction protein
MSNQVTVKVHCRNTDQWYDIDSSTDIDELQEQIQDELHEGEEDRVEDIELHFDQWETPSLLVGFESSNEIPADLPEAIKALEDTDNDLEVYEAYEDNMSTSPSDLTDIEQLIKDADEAYQGEYDSDEKFAQEMADQLEAVDKNASWPMNCIDWEYAAKELMYDYFESNGHYFRNI